MGCGYAHNCGFGNSKGQGPARVHVNFVHKPCAVLTNNQVPDYMMSVTGERMHRSCFRCAFSSVWHMDCTQCMLCVLLGLQAEKTVDRRRPKIAADC